MKIDNMLLKEKSLTRELVGGPGGQLQVKFNRMNYMPEQVNESGKFTCYIDVSCMISDQNQNGIGALKVSYYIFVSLDEGESFNQNETADKVFQAVRLPYWSAMNGLITEAGLPPMPLTNFFPAGAVN